ncbi:MAG: hypothetical protein ACE367_09185 [Acidimicrobiales bacterium]
MMTPVGDRKAAVVGLMSAVVATMAAAPASASLASDPETGEPLDER